LLLYRLQADHIVPGFLGEPDHPWLRALLEERERFVGRPRRDLALRWQEPLRVAAPPRKRALAAHVLEGLAEKNAAPGQRARELRGALFRAAAASAAGRAEILERTSAELGMTATDLEARLFADLPDLQPVPPLARAVSPAELAARANQALARGLLARADRVTVALEGNALPVVRRARVAGLIVNVLGDAGNPRLEISGPLALFHHTRVYGRALGGIVPCLSWCSRFALEATCVLEEGRGTLRLATGDPLFPSEEPRPFDSRLEEDFARRMRHAAPEWDVVRDPHPLSAGDGLVFPDFALAHREDRSRRWTIEIVGFWTPAYLERKLSSYRNAKVSNLILCIDERRRCAEGALPPGAKVVWFRRRIDPAAVLQAMRDARAPAQRSDEQREVLDAIRATAADSRYGNAFLPVVERRIGRNVEIAELIALCRAGLVALNRPTKDLAIRPLAMVRPPLSVEPSSVERTIAGAIEATVRSGLPPLYHMVREHYDWLQPDGTDALRPVVDELVRLGKLPLRS
jgi:predicted nuclease of restriction endonuclease-like RecB superfamily